MANAVEIMFSGMSRSGNHAIINWIWRQSRGRKCFLNCAEGKSNPFETCRPLDDGEAWRVNYDGFDLGSERNGRFSTKDLLLHSYEDCFLSYAYSRVYEDNHDRFVGPSRKRFDVLVLRDPFNLFASRLALNASPLTPRMALRVWKQHAREFLGRRRHLRHNKLVISYNRWVADPAYRVGLASRLGLVLGDEGLDAVAACAGGSSFDGLHFDGRARHMRVLERWRHFAHVPDYWAIFDDEAVALSRRAFGFAPAPGGAGPWRAEEEAARRATPASPR